MKFVGPLTSGIAGRHCSEIQKSLWESRPYDHKLQTTTTNDLTAFVKLTRVGAGDFTSSAKPK